MTRAAQDGFLPTNEAKHWIKEIRHILVLLHVEFFNNPWASTRCNKASRARLAWRSNAACSTCASNRSRWCTASSSQLLEKQLGARQLHGAVQP